MLRPTHVLFVSGLVVSMAVACTSARTGDADVAVSLRDDGITLSPATAQAGSVTLAAANDGTTTHEIEVFRGDVDPNRLPIENNVASTEGLELVDEIEDITSGSTTDLTVDLNVGTYVIMCNLPGHFANGMHAVLSIT